MAEFITSEMVRRKIIFDCMTNPQKAFQLLGMVGVSEEGAKKEEEESLRRLSAVEPLVPLLTIFAGWLTEMAVSFQMEIVTDPAPGFEEQLTAMLRNITQGSLVSTLAVLHDLGLVVLPIEVSI